jgi:ribosomal peptide maturation radical SAM protein 1
VADVALVAMPFGPLFTPTISLSLLKPALARRGISSTTHYFLIDYAERVGVRFYNSIVDHDFIPLTKLAGEWIFSGALLGSSPEGVQTYVEKVLLDRDHGLNRCRKVSRRRIERLVAEHAAAGAFVDVCLEQLLAHQPRVVALTSAFEQHVPSLALAKRIKAAAPDTFILLGGANCEGAMGAETVRQFAFVDATLSGEGDVMFPELVSRLLDGKPTDDLPGIRTRAKAEREVAARHFDNTPPILDLDALPEPDYEDYLQRFRRSRFYRYWQPRLIFETSRGCWWGERSHCTFCGLNGATMQFRSKSAGRVLGELESIVTRYPGYDVDTTDNILDLGYFESVLPALARRNVQVGLFYETKSNLKKDQVRLLRAAGITRIQPGIESLSDDVLRRVRKGVSALQNIQLLKWCKEAGLEVAWNILCGIPGEPAAEYERMAEIVPLLTHLPPPDCISRVRLDRFSPNFFDAERQGFRDVRPVECYRHIYRSLPAEALHNLAYYFDYDYRVPQDPDAYAAALDDAVCEWGEVHAQSALFSIDSSDHLMIWDLRPAAQQFLTVLSGLERRVYLACDAISYPRRLAALLNCREDDVAAAVAPLADRGLMLRDGERLLALAIPLGEYAPEPAIVERFHAAAQAVGQASSGRILIPWNAKAVQPVDVRRRRGRRPRPLDASRFAVGSNYVALQRN